MSWELNRVGDMCKVKSGKRLPKGMSVQDKRTTRKYLRVTDLKSHVVDESDIKYISEDIFKLISRYTISCDDIYISIAGTVGKVGIIPASIDGISLTENCCKLTELNKSKIIQHFLLHYLRSYEGQSKIQAKTGGASQPKLAITRLKDILIPTPPLQTQKRIADILSTYDDLIENNLKRIKLLEQAAQNIYKEWFVNLRFPGYENTPINEKTGLPLGFKEVLVNSKALYFGRGITPKYKDGSGIFGINQKVNKGSIIETEHMKEFDPELNIPEKKYAHFGDVLINSLGEGTIGRVHFYSGKSVIHPVDQHMSIFRSEDLGLNLFMYLFFSSNEGQGLLASIKKGGTNMTMLNIGDLRKLEITIPNRKTLLKLQDIVLPFFKNKNLLLNQNQKLKAARDILLPRLMNRTIEV
jgi:type I restriction enzyme, S subunit